MAYHVNFPADHPLHAGFRSHTVAQNPVLAQADVILAIDSDVPWIPSVNRPSAGVAIYCVDVDPLKASMNMWQVPARRFAAASARVAVAQIARFVRDNNLADPAWSGSGEKRPPTPTNRNWPNEPAASNPKRTARSPRNTSPRASGGC